MTYEFIDFAQEASWPARAAAGEERWHEERRARLLRINQFVTDRNLVGKLYRQTDRKLVLLDFPGAEPVEPRTIDTYMAARLEVDRGAKIGGVMPHCYDIALSTYRADVAIGMIGTYDIATLIGSGGHFINYDLLPDGTAVGLDLTARENIDDGVGRALDILALRARNLPELLAQTGELYGGDWRVVEPL